MTTASCGRSGTLRAAGRERRESQRAASVEDRPLLCADGWQHRLPCEWSGPRDVDDGYQSSITAASRRTFVECGAAAPMRSRLPKRSALFLSDKNVKGVLVNIFGGIMRCTTIAEALLVAYKTVGFTVPLVVRLEGTEVEQDARKLLADSGVAIIRLLGTLPKRRRRLLPRARVRLRGWPHLSNHAIHALRSTRNGMPHPEQNNTQIT